MIKNIGIFKDYQDGSIKTVFESSNGIIEMTLLFNKEDMDVVCVPTHHFCNLECKMCHLTNKGLNKRMIPIEKEDFYESLISTITNKEGLRRTNKKKLKISFMGVGEPLLNINLIEDVYKMEDKIKEYGYTTIGYSISTMMPNNNMLKLKEIVNRLNMPLKVHFSLHTPIDEERFLLIPNSKVTVKEALDYLKDYKNCLQNNEEIMNKYTKMHITDDPTEIHYTLISGVNDSKEELDRMCNLLKEYKTPIKFIRFNPINELKRSVNEEIWVNTIKETIPDLRVKVYSPPGREIGSSCGEFTKHYYHEEIETEEELKEFEEWKEHHQIEI